MLIRHLLKAFTTSNQRNKIRKCKRKLKYSLLQNRSFICLLYLQFKEIETSFLKLFFSKFISSFLKEKSCRTRLFFY